MEAPKALIHIQKAEGLKSMNHFSGDHPYCVCQVKRADGQTQGAQIATKPLMDGDTLNPIWDEAFQIEPWEPGDALEFSIYDKGLLGAKTEGKAFLSAEEIYPGGFNGALSISGLADAGLFVEVQIGIPEAVDYGAPAATYEAQELYVPLNVYSGLPTEAHAETIEGEEPPEDANEIAPSATYSEIKHKAYNMPQVSPTGFKVAVSILQAQGLKHMNHFTGDNVYAVCEVRRSRPHGESLKMTTKSVTENAENPFWGETQEIEPFFNGDSLEFTVYDKGLVGAKTEGKAVLPAEMVYPNGYSGWIQLSGSEQSLLHVIVRPLAAEVALKEEDTAGSSNRSKSKKKLKTSKKGKQCC